MVLVHRFRIVHAAIELRNVVLREADERLDVYQDVEGKSKTCMRRFEMCVAWTGFVHFDDDQAGCECGGAKDVEEEVRQCSCALLRGGVCWLEDERGLDGEQEAGGVEELFARTVSMSFFRLWGKCGLLTGCAEKKINFLLKIAPQTIAARIQIPA
jgi:hypothetical protein